MIWSNDLFPWQLIWPQPFVAGLHRDNDRPVKTNCIGFLRWMSFYGCHLWETCMCEKFHVLFCIPQNRMCGTSLGLFSFIYESSLHVQCFHHALRPSEESRLFLKWFQFILLSCWWPGFLSVLESLSALWRTFSVLEATPRAQEPKKRRIARCLFAGSIFHRIFFTFRVPWIPKNNDSV